MSEKTTIITPPRRAQGIGDWGIQCCDCCDRKFGLENLCVIASFHWTGNGINRISREDVRHYCTLCVQERFYGDDEFHDVKQPEE